MSGLYIGLMSGTSLDGVDGVLAQAGPDGRWMATRHAHCAFGATLRAELLALNSPGHDELHRSALAAQTLAEVYAQVVHTLLVAAAIPAAAVNAIGAHGQTVRHRPGPQEGHGAGTARVAGYTAQLMNGALLAELTGIDVVCDLRSRDVAAGGQGAPLVPAFHAGCFSRAGRTTAVLNVGGIANLTLLHANGHVAGFDTGPGNLLMDLWASHTLGSACDLGGALASRGQVDTALLARLRSEPFFAQPPPKSTGRDLFNAPWLQAQLAGSSASNTDVMATLAELTASSAVQALHAHAPDCDRLLVCGGGAFNAHLMTRLAALAGPDIAVTSTAQEGVPPDQVEALAFAWLAWAFKEKRPGNLPAVTGARGPRLLGALYPA